MQPMKNGVTPEWVESSYNRRLLEPLGHVPPVESEQAYCRAHETPAVGPRVL